MVVFYGTSVRYYTRVHWKINLLQGVRKTGHPIVYTLACLYTGYSIEKYVGWTDMSSYFIFNNSGVCPHFRKPYNYLNILPRNQ